MPQTLTVVNSLHTGLNVTPADLDAATDTDVRFDNDGNTMLAVYNGGGSSLSVTVNAQRSGPFDDVAVNETGSVPAGKTYLFGPYAPERFNDTAYQVRVTLGATTSVKLKAIQTCKPLDGTAR